MIRNVLLAATAIAAAVPALASGPLQLTSSVMVEAKARSSDGSTAVTLVPAKRVVPGDRVVYVLTYRNTGSQSLSDVVIANPLPTGIAYRAAADGSPTPEVSADGRTFAPIAALRVASATGVRAATPSDVTHIRWRLARPLTAGAQGQFSFQAVLK